MPTEDGPAPGGGPSPGRARVLTTLPDRGTVLVRSSEPPAVPADRCVDVRPGPFATFDGDRLRLALSVSDGEDRRRFDRSELGAVEDAIVSFLEAGGAPTDRGSDATERFGPDGGYLVVVRFGDRAACVRRLPRASVRAVERRLGRAARRGSAVLLTWTGSEPRPDDEAVYDVVLDRPPAEPDDTDAGWSSGDEGPGSRPEGPG